MKQRFKLWRKGILENSGACKEFEFLNLLSNLVFGVIWMLFSFIILQEHDCNILRYLFFGLQSILSHK